MSESSGTGDTTPTGPSQPQKSFGEILRDNKQLGVGGIIFALLSTGVMVSREDLSIIEKDVSTLEQKVSILISNHRSLVEDLRRAGEDSRRSEMEFERIKELVFRREGKEERVP